MLETNKIYNIDCLDGLKLLDNNSIDLIITSPPYNKAGFNGVNKRTNNCIWNKTINYGGDVNSDNMDEEEYEKWQINILNECFRILKPNGSMFYNHKFRVHKNKGKFPSEWINKSKMLTRQVIIWDRGRSVNMDKCRYFPTTEYIFWLIKQPKNPKFKRNDNIEFKGEVWKIPPIVNSKHPAPFPIDIPNNIIPNINYDNERLLVLDPFMGSGTVAISAIKNNCDYIGFEKYEEYYQMANDNIKKETTIQ